MLSKRHKVVMGVCMSKSLQKHIDRERGDIPRSRYISRILEEQFVGKKGKENKRNSYSFQPRESAHSLCSPSERPEDGATGE
jgi:hypothetical protein